MVWQLGHRIRSHHPLVWSSIPQTPSQIFSSIKLNRCWWEICNLTWSTFVFPGKADWYASHQLRHGYAQHTTMAMYLIAYVHVQIPVLYHLGIPPKSRRLNMSKWECMAEGRVLWSVWNSNSSWKSSILASLSHLQVIRAPFWGHSPAFGVLRGRSERCATQSEGFSGYDSR